MKVESNAANMNLGMARLLFLLFLVTACATPVGVTRVDPRIVHHELTSNVLSQGVPSGPAEIVLNRHDLHERFAKTPEVALADLHRLVVSGRGGADETFALAELSFIHAEKTGKRSFYLASSVYAWAFLFPGGKDELPSPFDPRFRLASDLYNRGLTSGFKLEDGSKVLLSSGTFELPFGKLEVEFDQTTLQWHGRELVDFAPVAELEVRGLRNRYRQSGIGAPLAASTVLPDSGNKPEELVATKIRVPVTLVLRLGDVRSQLAEGVVLGFMRLYATDDVASVRIDDRNVPLEAEPTASLAVVLADPNIWEMELKAFFGGEYIRKILHQTSRQSQLVALHPYQPGLIPVVLVHGTASSPGRWADMTNELRNDPLIRERFQFWYFFYDTGNPIAYSAMLLREALTKTLQSVDPGGMDPALKEMVVIGHSQGGLLAKMTAIDSGTRFWDNISSKPFNEAEMKEETRDLLRRALFIKPLPFVKRLIFIATPQRGSYVAGWKAIKWFTGLLVKPATAILTITTDILFLRDTDTIAMDLQTSVPTSVDNMNPGNRFIKTLAAIPIAPGVAFNSIIAVKQDEDIEDGDDGVVKYKSAHLGDAESELVVSSDHSCQGNPHTIEEVRRILLLQASMEQQQ
jgi:pimeloyl-ACP methyl ester carboxylesterase